MYRAKESPEIILCVYALPNPMHSDSVAVILINTTRKINRITHENIQILKSTQVKSENPKEVE